MPGKRNPVMRTTTASEINDGTLNVEFIADDRGGYIWIGLGTTKCIGHASLAAVKKFLISAEKAQAEWNKRRVLRRMRRSDAR